MCACVCEREREREREREVLVNSRMNLVKLRGANTVNNLRTLFKSKTGSGSKHRNENAKHVEMIALKYSARVPKTRAPIK